MAKAKMKRSVIGDGTMPERTGRGTRRQGCRYLFSVFDGTLSGFRFNGPPRVARSSQPWAEGRNPYGIGMALHTYGCRRSRAVHTELERRLQFRIQARCDYLRSLA